MAIRLNNGVTNEYLLLENDASPISTGASSAWSMACWVYRDADMGTNETIAVMANDTVGVATTTVSGIRVNSSDSLQSVTSGGTSTIRSPLTVGQWVYAAVSFGNGTGTSYHGTTPGTLTAGTGRANTAGIFDTLVVGRHPATAAPFSGRIAHLRLWTGTLSEAEFEAEMALDSHLKTTGLWAAYEFPNDSGTYLDDTSGNGRELFGFACDFATNYIAGPLAVTPSQSNAPRASLLRMLRSA
jgi:hypothetical protein